MNKSFDSVRPALPDIRILDFSWVLAGPYATRILADFGVEVIKVQPPLPEAQDTFSRGYYNNWNRGKLGITLNMGCPEGIALARKLVQISDAVIENFSPRVMTNWGLNYPELKKIKPDIIALSMSVMGQTGPWKDYSGFGPTVQSFSGLTCLTTCPSHPPLGIGYSYADHVAALYACLSLLGALEHRHRTGEGQYIDLSQCETMSSLLADAFLEYSLEGQVPLPVGNGSPLASPHGVYRCRGENQWCAVAVSTEKEWISFKRALGVPAWMKEERFASLASRLRHKEALDALVQTWTIQHSAEEVMVLLQREGIPAGIVKNAADLAQDPQLQERGFFLCLENPEMGMTMADASPLKLSRNPPVYGRSAPAPGRDNEYVYRRLLGLTEDQIQRLKRNNVI